VNSSKGFLVGGISAGGNLTVVVSHLYRDAGLSPPLTGCYCSIPSTCAAEALPEQWEGMYLSREQNANAPVLNSENLAVFSTLYAADPSSPLRSPLLYPSHEGLPPTYLQVCGMDPLRDEGLIYERVLREAGVKTKMDIYPGLPHWFWGMWPEAEFTKKFKTDCRVGLEWLLEMSGERGKVGRVWRDEVEKVGVNMTTNQDGEL
jgi:acetyl esterase/lipase